MSAPTLNAIYRVIDWELIFLNKIEDAKRRLIFEKDFSVDDAFNSIDLAKHGVISRAALKRFFEKTRIYVLPEDIDAILHRIASGRVDRVKFVKAVLPHGCTRARECPSSTKRPGSAQS
jgi:hypothetical protein